MTRRALFRSSTNVLRLDEDALRARIALLDADVELVHDGVGAAARHVAGDVDADVRQDVFGPDLPRQHLVHALDLAIARRQALDLGHDLAVGPLAYEKPLRFAREPQRG